jgi:hypothetical protein
LQAAIGDLLFIPRTRAIINGEEIDSEAYSYASAIPCLYLPNAAGSTKLLIYFHGNAEDVGLASELLDYVRTLLKVHVIAVEYPGYGVYDG